MKKRTLMLCVMCALLVITVSGCGKPQDSGEDVSITAENSSEETVENDADSAELVENDFSSFQTWDFEGNEVDQSIFEDYDLTMINIWATFCTPCLSEMPELGELNEEYRDQGFQVIGIVIDLFNQDGSVSEEQFQLAVEIAAATNANYTHLLPSSDLIQIKLKDVTSVPETIFVNKNGALVGQSYLGARSKEAWAQIIDELLEEVK